MAMVNTTHSLVAFMWATAAWCVYMGGLASLQAQCSQYDDGFLAGIYGFSTSLGCRRVFRFQWFILALEAFAVVFMAIAFLTNQLGRFQTSFVGLFSILSILYIYSTDQFLSALLDADTFSSGSSRDRMRTTLAGSLMTAALNMVVVIVVGMNNADASVQYNANAAVASKTDVAGASVV